MTTVLIIGSGPNALEARSWPRGVFDVIVAINNAWRVREDWNYLIYPEDFPADRRPYNLKDGQTRIQASDFVPHQNQFGGFVYAGGTMHHGFHRCLLGTWGTKAVCHRNDRM